MTLRWYGAKFDTVTLKQIQMCIRDSPYVVNIVNVKRVASPGSPYAIALAGDILFMLFAFLIFFCHSSHGK